MNTVNWAMIGAIAAIAAVLVPLGLYLIKAIKNIGEWKGAIDANQSNFKTFTQKTFPAFSKEMNDWKGAIDANQSNFKTFTQKTFPAFSKEMNDWKGTIDANQSNFKTFTQKTFPAFSKEMNDWKETIDANQSNFKTFTQKTFPAFSKEVNDRFAFLQKLMFNILMLLPKSEEQAIAKGESPLSLTDLGERISEKLNAVEWANGTAPALLVQVQGKPPHEIQEFCIQQVLQLEGDMETEVKKTAYDMGLTDYHMRMVLAIVLRDVFLGLVDTNNVEDNLSVA